jgi:hypothetical protein
MRRRIYNKYRSDENLLTDFTKDYILPERNVNLVD